MSRLTILAASVASMLIHTAGALAEFPATPAPDRASLDWIRKGKVRAGYCNLWSPEELPVKLATAGFNTLHVQFCHGGYGDIKR